MERSDPQKKGVTRRQFLKVGPVGLAGGIALAVVAGKPLFSRVRRSIKASRLPKGSIFTPAEGDRMDI